MNEKQCKAILKKYHQDSGSTISLLQDIQEVFGYIPEDVVFWFADELNVPASTFYGVATFYSQFYLKPRGKNILTACCGTACHVKGSAAVINKVKTDLNLPDGEKTTKDLKFTLENVACVGACSIAPVLIANKKVYGKVTPEEASDIIKELK
jgi:NADH:ubiquinone oxidoreductase subunit E